MANEHFSEPRLLTITLKIYFLSIINQDSFICRFRNIGLSRFSYHEFEPETPNKKIKQFEEGVRAVSVCRISALFRT